MTAIQVRKTAEEPGSASLAVTVPVAEVREAEERATTSYQQRARLPGFRRGKAPPALVRKHFAEDIRQETLQQLIRASWKVALEQETLQPVADPHIHNLKWRSEEHTSELQSRLHLVCRLLLEKKNRKQQG